MSEPAKPIPCPWCRSENISVEWEHCERLDSTDTNRRWFAECGKCACQGPFCQTEPEVIPAWNHRATDARLAQAEKALAELRAIADSLATAAKKLYERTAHTFKCGSEMTDDDDDCTCGLVEELAAFQSALAACAQQEKKV